MFELSSYWFRLASERADTSRLGYMLSNVQKTDPFRVSTVATHLKNGEGFRSI